jgi:1,4-dihydroxy-2-naphthoyl-CoA hydrolase
MSEATFWDDVVGQVIGEWSAARVTATVEIGPRHHQPYGIVHGGVWCSIVESVASHGAARAATDLGAKGVVGVSNSTDFLRPHSNGTVDVVGVPIHVGRTQQIWVVEIARRPDGKLVARGQVRLQNLHELPGG